MTRIAIIAASVSLVLMTGCASILNEDTQQINISSSNGKEIQGTIDGAPFTAPGIVAVKRQNNAKIINVDTAGCAKQTVVDSTVDSKFFINILSGGAFGSTTDYATEKMWKYSDSVVISCGQ